MVNTLSVIKGKADPPFYKWIINLLFRFQSKGKVIWTENTFANEYSHSNPEMLSALWIYLNK